MPAIEVLIKRVMLSHASRGPSVLVYVIFLPRNMVGIGQGDYFSGIGYIH